MHTNKRKLVAAKVVAIASAIPLLLFAYAEGPDPGHSGVPGERNCTACHSGVVNSGAGSVAVAFPGALTYTPGVKQHLVVTVSDPDQRRWGFQLTARRESDSKLQTGSFQPTDTNTQVICSTADLSPASCSDSTLQFIEHTPVGTRNGTTQSAAFELDWTPPSTDVGAIVVYVAGNAANGNNANTGDHIYTKSYTLTPAAGSSAPTITSVENGASFKPGFQQGSWVTVKGSNFGSSTRTWRADEIVNGQLPTQLDNVSVNINGKAAYVYFISPGQINVQAPSDDSLGDVPVEVTVNGVKSDPFTGRLQTYSPAFFPWPGNYVVATDANFNWKIKDGTFPGTSTTPAKPGEIIILWGTGFGPTTPAIPAGTVVDKTSNVVDTPTVRIGDLTAEYLGGALTPGAVGLYQIVIRIPENAPDGDAAITAQIGGVASPDGPMITIQK